MKTFTKDHSLIAKGVAIMLLLLYHLFREKQVLDEMAVNYAPFSENAHRIPYSVSRESFSF